MPHARWADVFCEPTSPHAFDADESRRVLEAAGAAGPRPAGARQPARARARACAWPSSSARRASTTAPSSTRRTSTRLAGGTTVATLLPGVEFSTRMPYPDARRLLAAGVTVALATDCNPGTSYTSSMPFVIALAVRELGMTPAEAVWAATAGGAMALRRNDIGRVASVRGPTWPSSTPLVRPPCLPAGCSPRASSSPGSFATLRDPPCGGAITECGSARGTSSRGKNGVPCGGGGLGERRGARSYLHPGVAHPSGRRIVRWRAAFTLHPSEVIRAQQRLQSPDGVGVLGQLVRPVALDPREPQRHARPDSGSSAAPRRWRSRRRSPARRTRRARSGASRSAGSARSASAAARR